MRRILVITTTYRVGEKIYPIIPELSKDCEVDVLNLYQMSPETQWVGSQDPRLPLYDLWTKICGNVFVGPEFVEDTDTNAKTYGVFVSSLDSIFKNIPYHLVIVDNNITVKGGKVSEIYEYFHNRNIKVIACPHANRDYRGYKVLKRIGGHYDYSFVFGKKEKAKLLKEKENKKYLKHKDKLISGGIPSNDRLCKYQRGNKYVLVIPNFTDPAHIGGITSGVQPFTKKVFDSLNLLGLAEEHEVDDIVIKEKNRLFHPSTVLQRALKSHKNVHFMLDCEDDNKLIADAACVVSDPSTITLKPIQLGIPTVVLKKHGMVGNLYDFPGLIDCDSKQLRKSLSMQKGRCEQFIKETLTGGWEFNATSIYIRHIKFILGD